MKNSQESQATVSGNLVNQMRPIQHGAPEPSTMTQPRYNALMGALTRASDEWEAEMDHEAEHDDSDDSRYLELKNQIERLAEARAVLVARFPLQSKAYGKSLGS